MKNCCTQIHRRTLVLAFVIVTVVMASKSMANIVEATTTTTSKSDIDQDATNRSIDTKERGLQDYMGYNPSAVPTQSRIVSDAPTNIPVAVFYSSDTPTNSGDAEVSIVSDTPTIGGNPFLNNVPTSDTPSINSVSDPPSMISSDDVSDVPTMMNGGSMLVSDTPTTSPTVVDGGPSGTGGGFVFTIVTPSPTMSPTVVDGGPSGTGGGVENNMVTPSPTTAAPVDNSMIEMVPTATPSGVKGNGGMDMPTDEQVVDNETCVKLDGMCISSEVCCFKRLCENGVCTKRDGGGMKDVGRRLRSGLRKQT
jgi:hypothetical protein